MMAGPSTSAEYEYRFPSLVSAPSFVTVTLSGPDNYNVWREQMNSLIKRHDMDEFIQDPPDRNNKFWLRSDALVRGWILATISLQTLKWVLQPNLDLTAKDIWCKLLDVYGSVSKETGLIRCKYPYPSFVSPQSFVTVKQDSRDTYAVWREQMLGLLERHRMVDFVLSSPPDIKTLSWLRSDKLVLSWIVTTLSRQTINRVFIPNQNVTSKELWCKLRDDSHEHEEAGPSSDYPYPSHVSALSFVTVKLSGRDTYVEWREQMKCLLHSHGMIGFIVSKPDYHSKSWGRSDELVKGWIYATISLQTLKWVLEPREMEIYEMNVPLTASNMWFKLLEVYGPVNPQKQEGYFKKDRIKKIRTEEINRLLNIYDAPPTSAEEDNDTLFVAEEKHKLYNAIINEDFVDIERICKRKVFGLFHDLNGDTALHLAVGTSNNKEFLEKLFNLATHDHDELYILNSDGNTLLNVIASVGNTEAAKVLFKKSPRSFGNNIDILEAPAVVALSNMHTDTYLFLWDCYVQTEPRNISLMHWKGSELLFKMISSKDYALALNTFRGSDRIINRLPDPNILLMAIAQNFPHKLNFWERTIYKWLKTSEAAKRNEADYDNCIQLLTELCSEIKQAIGSKRHHDCYNDAMLEATRQNAYKVVRIIVSAFPNAIWSRNEDGHNIIQYAVINRSEKVYNLLYQMSQHQNIYKTMKDQFGNNLLHLAARLAPIKTLNLISGAALQIQFELQWFKEVERFVAPTTIKHKNWYGETPEMIFTKEHKELVIEGEKWMKETAQSYTITAALIITIAFAAAITVPGGNNQDSGIPVFTDKTAFKIFAVSDAISLFASVTSLLMFLSILTARFSEQDFLYKLPTKLIIGLATLFISTTAMLVAFGATLFIVFGRNNSMTLVPIALLTCLPVASFLSLQFPLVYDLISATYGRSIFGKKSNHHFY